jgi:DNA-binding NarL/FixJ family response regulator
MKVVIVDDEIAMHLIMKRMLNKIEKVEILGSFQETAAAFSFFKDNTVDLAFIDISMPRENGLDFARRLRESNKQVKLVFVTSHKEYALPAFDVYAYDYIVKPISKERLIKTIDRAIAEEETNKREIPAVELSISLPPLIEPLTKREIEVLQLISDGLTNKEIAETYELTEGTIKNHIVNIFGKLQVKNRVQATLIAKKHKMIN